MRNCEIYVSDAQSDFDCDFDVSKVATAKNIEVAGVGISDIENDGRSLGDMFTGILSGAVSMYTDNAISDRAEILTDLGEIADLRINEERIMETEEREANLKDQEDISDRRQKLKYKKKNLRKGKGLGKFQKGNRQVRTKLGNIDRWDLLLLIQLNIQEKSKRKGKFASQYQEIELRN